MPGSRNEELVTPIHIASLNLRIKILSVLLKENQVRAPFDRVVEQVSLAGPKR